MIYITGDTHGEQGRFLYNECPIEKELSATDMIIVCGDFGFLFQNDKKEEEFLDLLATKPYRVLFIDGNHENFDALLAFPVEEWKGGKVHVIRRDVKGEAQIIHLMRGQVFTLEGKTFFTFGGGYSFDKGMLDLSGRPVRVPHVSWWEEEMPSDEEKKEGLRNLALHNNRVDYVLTHAAPERVNYKLRKWDAENKEQALNSYLQWIYETVSFKHWYLGHHHQDDDLDDKMTCVYYEIRNIETNECMGKRGVCHYRLLLNSRGLNVSSGRKQIKAALKGENLAGKSIFLVSADYYEIEDILLDACLELGFVKEKVFFSRDYEGLPFHQMPSVDFVYVSEGNTFVIMEYMGHRNRDGSANEFVAYIRRMIWDEGACYIGSSAGAVIATETIEPAKDFDDNFVGLNSYVGIGLLPGTMIPHYDREAFDTYYAALSEYDINRYKRIQYVSNDEILVCEMLLKDCEVLEVKRKRIRVKEE